MEQQSLPLKDIHLPSTISWWPLAPGWWIMLGLIILMALLWRFRRHIRAWFAPGLRRIALKQLDVIATNPHLSTRKKVQRISQLLRQSAISNSPRNQVAGLAGEQWLEFLDNNNPQKPFSTGAGRSLIDAPYRQDAELDIDAIVELTRDWLKQNAERLPKQAKRL
ncbi:MAG: DUF4381 domain-containing protein [Methylococcales bacterium]